MATKKSTDTVKSTSAAKGATAGKKATTEVKPAPTKAAAAKKAPVKAAAKKAEAAHGGKLGEETSPVVALDAQAAEAGGADSSAAAEAAPAGQAKARVSQEHVAVHAYHKWQNRGSHHGAHEHDWHEAERELNS